MEKSAKACNVMCSKLGFSKGHDISLQDLSHSSVAQQPSKPGKKNGTVRTTQRTHGVSTYKLHCTAKTAKFLARKLTAKQVQKHAEHAESNTDHVAATADHASENNVLPSKSQSMHLHTRAQNRGFHRNQIFAASALAANGRKVRSHASRVGALDPF